MTNGGSGVRVWCAASTAVNAADCNSSYEAELDRKSDTTVQTNSEDFVKEEVSCITEARLSPDGTCIFTAGYDRKFSIYPIASDVLEGSSTQSLTPYAQFSSSDPIWAFAVNPYFDMNDSDTTTVLVSRRDQYVSLHNSLWDVTIDYEKQDQEGQIPYCKSPVNISTKLASYKLVDRMTEAVTAPMSLAWSPDGAYFYAGHKNTISTFDLNDPDGPISYIRTIPSDRNKLVGGGYGFKGDISALSLSPPASTTNARVLAAGSRTRAIGIYDAVSSEETTHFSLPGTVNGRNSYDPHFDNAVGKGVTQLKWSPDGKYLYIAERNSDALLIYDVRNFKMALGYCAGRQAFTKQKLGFDIWTRMDEYSTGEFHEVWAGGVDGKLRVWRNPYLFEGAVEAEEVIDVGGDPVSSVLVHPYGNAAVVGKGRREVGSEQEGKGVKRGGVTTPSYREWGRLDILGLGSY
ncbi:hypothetical protein N0V90_006737 [Kalmusia sp. IMI 367209]|nr:hypothetical protein N0V90_006737 [Kalmusia sp. IMI 367209]